jgi:hypothetical protein
MPFTGNRDRYRSRFAWIFFGLIVALLTAGIIYDLSHRPAGEGYSLGEISFLLVPLAFAFVGALIISRQPRNVIGLLMMLPGISLSVLVDAYLRPFISGVSPVPQSPSPVFLLILWYSNWNWLLLLFPLIFIMVLFPTGHPLSPRWGRLIYVGLGIAAVFILLITFSQSLAPGSGGVDWSFRNPIGFLEPAWIDFAVVPLLVAFPVWIVLCAVALLVSFRRASGIEREQIKWLFYASTLFAVIYVPTFVGNTYSQAESIWNFLLWIGMLAFPAAIAIAILRYRLWDIDIIIRRTLVYAALTATLAVVYFSSVVLMQNIVTAVSARSAGSPSPATLRSPVAIVISTLIIAALFNPLRGRIQDDIDRRFYRNKYDAEKVVAAFSASLREEVDLDDLQDHILEVVQETLQPEMVSLWLRPEVEMKVSR